jgi:transcriptional regulator with XRE-family HTH domain
MTASIIKSIMRKNKIGNKELAEKSGVPIGTLNKILYGDTKNPSLDTMRAIAHALGCTLDDFSDSTTDLWRKNSESYYADAEAERTCLR